MSTSRTKVYLGDSVYAEFDGYAYTLTTENGFGASNTIVLEQEVMAALEDFIGHLRARAKQRKQLEKGGV